MESRPFACMVCGSDTKTTPSLHLCDECQRSWTMSRERKRRGWFLDRKNESAAWTAYMDFINRRRAERQNGEKT